MSARCEGPARARRARRAYAAAAALVVAGGLAAIACDVVALGPGPRKVAVTETVERVLLPAFAEAEGRGAALARALEALHAAPNAETLAAAQAAWRDAHLAWKAADPFLFGPTKGQDAVAKIDFATALDDAINPAYVDDEIEGGAELSPAYVAERGTSRKGFHAIEYLLFAPGAEGAPLVRLTGDDAAAVRRRQYLVGLGAHLEGGLGRLRGLWADPSAGYAAALAAPGPENLTFPAIKASVDALLAGLVHTCDRLLIERLGEPLGNKSGGAVRPDALESRFADHSIADIAASLEGLERVYLARGVDGEPRGLTVVVAGRAAGTDARVRAAIADARAAVAAIPAPLAESLRDRRATVEAAYEKVRALRFVLGGEVQSLLGASVAPVDTDQD